MNIKKGGGNHDQPYDVRSGRYVNKDMKAQDLYSDNPFITRHDGLLWVYTHNGKEPPRPVYYEDGRNKDYIEWYIECYVEPVLKEKDFRFDKKKIWFLFRKSEKNDKSKMLQNFGFNETNAEIFKNQIFKNTIFSKVIKWTAKQWGINMCFITYLTNPITKERKPFVTVWTLNDKNGIHFVTIIPSKIKEGN